MHCTGGGAKRDHIKKALDRRYLNSESDPLLASNVINTLLLKFKMSSLEQCNGSGDLDDHLQEYKTVIRLHGATEPLMCMDFPTKPRKAAGEWFNNLSQWSITSFKDLVYAFYNQFAANKKRKRNSTCLLAISHKKMRNLDISFTVSILRGLKIGT